MRRFTFKTVVFRIENISHFIELDLILRSFQGKSQIHSTCPQLCIQPATDSSFGDVAVLSGQLLRPRVVDSRTRFSRSATFHPHLHRARPEWP